MERLRVIETIVSSIMEMGAVFLIISSMSKVQGVAKKKFVASMVLVLAGVIGIVNYFDISRFYIMICYVAIFALIYYSYCFSFAETLISFILGVITVAMLELSIYLVIDCIVRGVFEDETKGIIVTFMVICICYYIYRNNILVQLRKIIKNCPKNVFILSCIAFVIVIITIYMFSSEAGLSLKEEIYFIAASLVVLYAIYKLSFYNSQMMLEKEYFKIYSELVETLRCRQHKFANQMDAIYALCYSEKNYVEIIELQKQHLEEMRKYLLPNKLLVLEKPIIIAHIYQKICKAKEENIQLHYEMTCSLKGIRIPDIYLVEIIGNLLDNAMEEVKNRNKNEKIYLKITQENGMWYIRVSNEHEKISRQQYMKFFKKGYSSKGKNHGMGLGYIKQVVQKYHGVLEVGNIEIDQKNCFSLCACIPQKRK